MKKPTRTNMHKRVTLERRLSKLSQHHVMFSKKLSYCCTKSQPALPASSSSGSAVWSSAKPLCCSSSAPSPHCPPPPPPSCLYLKPAGTSSALSSQKWQCSFRDPGAEWWIWIRWIGWLTDHWFKEIIFHFNIIWSEKCFACTNHEYGIQVCLLLSRLSTGHL